MRTFSVFLTVIIVLVTLASYGGPDPKKQGTETVRLVSDTRSISAPNTLPKSEATTLLPETIVSVLRHQKSL